ncbi:zincin [Fistulina hepatica ATCC 64428]|uniref:deuterolysin n=1 Tax=Fistulina hepatica ATCC 64428 TaxID=1128425 RepID=A0A0D7AEP6_9AGAR|nr:zincin [Fistulina hepatica ATCC 64428]
MLFAAVVFVCASFALASSHRRSGGLTVELTGPQSITSLDDLIITAAVTNGNSEDIQIQTYGTVLDTLPTHAFNVTTADNTELNFIGIELSVDLSQAPFTTIPAGETLTVNRSIADLYDFASVGETTLTISLYNTYMVARSQDNLTVVEVSAYSPVTVNVPVGLERRNVFTRALIECTSNLTEYLFISEAYLESKALAARAAAYVTLNGLNDSLYESYFGLGGVLDVVSVYDAVATEVNSSISISCTDPDDYCTAGVVTYTVTQSSEIVVCDSFFDEVTTSDLCSTTTVDDRDVRGGTLLRDLTLITSGTSSLVNGCILDRLLLGPLARINADSYSCFATQVYQDAAC